MVLALAGVCAWAAVIAAELRPLWLQRQALGREKQSLEVNIRRHQRYADPVYLPPLAVSDGEKAELDKRVPYTGNGPEAVVQLEQAASRAGVALTSVELVEDLSGLPFEAKKGASSKEESEKEELLRQALGVPADLRLKPVWYKVEAEVPRDKLAAFLEELKNGDRLVTVAGWDFQWTDPAESEKLAVYVIVYHYRDPELQRSVKASAPQPSVPPGS